MVTKMEKIFLRYDQVGFNSFQYTVVKIEGFPTKEEIEPFRLDSYVYMITKDCHNVLVIVDKEYKTSIEEGNALGDNPAHFRKTVMSILNNYKTTMQRRTENLNAVGIVTEVTFDNFGGDGIKPCPTYVPDKTGELLTIDNDKLLRDLVEKTTENDDLKATIKELEIRINHLKSIDAINQVLLAESAAREAEQITEIGNLEEEIISLENRIAELEDESHAK
jgi:hypothetical protein